MAKKEKDKRKEVLKLFRIQKIRNVKEIETCKLSTCRSAKYFVFLSLAVWLIHPVVHKTDENNKKLDAIMLSCPHRDDKSLIMSDILMMVVKIEMRALSSYSHTEK